MANLLLLGAGASFGSDSDCVPPLGKQLFDALCVFNPPGWGALPDQLGQRFRTDFEAAMKEMGDIYPHGLPPLQRVMAAYFFTFTPRVSSKYVQLARRIKATQWEGAICTLNYERLLELSVGSVGLRSVIGSDTIPGQVLEFCLPHGCCHIFCDGARGVSRAVSFSGFGVTTDGPVVVIPDFHQHRQRIDNDAFPPVMSYFESGKRTTAGASFIEAQRVRCGTLVEQADKIVVIGIRVRPHDSHIWDPIARSRADVVYCAGLEAGMEFSLWANRIRPEARNIVLSGFFAEEFDTICQWLGI